MKLYLTIPALWNSNSRCSKWEKKNIEIPSTQREKYFLISKTIAPFPTFEEHLRFFILKIENKKIKNWGSDDLWSNISNVLQLAFDLLFNHDIILQKATIIENICISYRKSNADGKQVEFFCCRSNWLYLKWISLNKRKMFFFFSSHSNWLVTPQVVQWFYCRNCKIIFLVYHVRAHVFAVIVEKLYENINESGNLVCFLIEFITL